MNKALPLVRFGCGCIGLHNPGGKKTENALVFKDCVEPGLILHLRGINAENIKNAVPLTENEIRSIVEEANQVLNDGSKFATIKNLIVS